AMTAAGKIAEGYSAASDPQAAFEYLTSGYEDEESSLTGEQLRTLLAEHERRVPNDARAMYLAGQALLRDEQYEAADAKFQAAMARPDDDMHSLYQSGRIEALYRMGDLANAYRTCGQTS